MNKLLQLLRTPYPSLVSLWKAILVPTALIFLILGVLQPFGIAHAKAGPWSIAAVSALIAAAASCACNLLLPVLLPAWYDERRWTIGKEMLHLAGMFLLIAIGVCLWVAWLTGTHPGVRLFFTALLWVLILGVFPTVLFILWNQNLLLRRNLHEARELNHTLATRHRPAQADSPRPDDMLLALRNGTKDTVQLPAHSFLYAEAEGNYIQIYSCTTDGGKPTRQLLRITLKEAEEAATACPSIIRCHRAFLVNLDKVVKVDGNQQGYRLHLEGCKNAIPVSRTYAKKLKERLKGSRHSD